jgi:hypothetical protein
VFDFNGAHTSSRLIYKLLIYNHNNILLFKRTPNRTPRRQFEGV